MNRLLVAVIVFFFLSPIFAAKKVMMVYKSPTCGCCQKWVDYMKSNGFNVEVTELSDVSPIKKKYGVPSNSTSCHTAIIDGYYIEGHVPAKDVQRLLKEKKPVAGLSVPEMPIGSPGMEVGNQKDPYDVFALSKDGKRTVFSSYNK